MEYHYLRVILDVEEKNPFYNTMSYSEILVYMDYTSEGSTYTILSKWCLKNKPI